MIIKYFPAPTKADMIEAHRVPFHRPPSGFHSSPHSTKDLALRGQSTSIHQYQPAVAAKAKLLIYYAFGKSSKFWGAGDSGDQLQMCFTLLSLTVRCQLSGWECKVSVGF